MIFNTEHELGKANSRIVNLEKKADTLLAKLGAAHRKIGILESENTTLKAEVEKLTIINKTLSDENVQLKKRLKIDSSNSNMPSSTNRFTRPTVSNRSKSEKSSGAQEGHDGNTLRFSSEATDEVYHRPESCKACGVALSEFNLVDTRQVHDVEISVKITNHYIYAGKCSCGCETVLETSGKIPHGVSYGNNIKSIMLCLHNNDLIPTNRLSQVASDIFGFSVSEGSIYNWQAELSNNLNPYEVAVISKLLSEPTLNVDESGIRIKILNYWLHVICSKNYTYYDVQAKRGLEAMEATGVLPRYTGNLMHDCFKSYHGLENTAQHGLCNAHLLRELKSMNQFYNVSFANKMRDLLLEMNTKSQANELTYQIILAYKAEFNKLIFLAETEAKKLDHEKWQKDVFALAKRLKEHGSKYLAFLDNPDIPFTNNQAEQDIRMIKTKQKISGGFRTDDYAKHFVKIRGFISTMRKQGKNVVNALSKIIADPMDYSFAESG